MQIRRGNKIGAESFFTDTIDYLNELKKFTKHEKNKRNYVYLSTDDTSLINEIEKK